VLAFLKRIYQRLPIVRELKALEMTLAVRHERQAILLTALLEQQMEAHERELLKDSRYSHPQNLNRHEFKMFSQYGEDGIIAEIFRRIGVSQRTFVEVGVGDGLENNTAALLFQGWRGYWVEGDEDSVRAIRRNCRKHLADGSLQVKCCFVSAENIQSVLREVQFPGEVDLFSLDVDQNTFWIWAALSSFRARVVVVEYNANVHPSSNWKVDYQRDKVWRGSLAYGAGLKAFEELGQTFGYRLVGCALSGANAFFVREDLCGELFEAPFTAEHHYQPPRYYLQRRFGHRAGFE
jgi:hypothetical protein